MTYADEEFYKNKYLLGRKPVISTGFPFYAREASYHIDWYTFGRLAAMTDIPEEVQMCCCELAEAIYQQQKTEKDASGKTSEKNGTYSVSYGSSQELATAAVQKQHQIVMKWLENIGLCYQGV